ncbi:cytochrome P450 [Testicularia cyperi]|uniref:Cytochrome P450 n=1 Tax=Testicularia cyperi TaxID=1882483 RepID=A0A317XLJ8_9BASI|nr:cytochrome P450 [Testicularia cyperi]
MKLEIDVIDRALALAHWPVQLFQQRPIFWTGALIVLLPFVLVLSLATWLFMLATTRWIRVNILRNDQYSHVPRPAHTGKLPLLQGDLGLIRKLPPVKAHLQFAKELGTPVFVYRGLFYSPRIFLADPKAMTHLLSAANSYNFPKPENARLVLKSFLGEGVLVAEGDVHKRQRKILQPAFGVAAIRELTPIFMKYSRALADKIGEMVDRSEGKGAKLGGPDGVNSAFRAQAPPSLAVSRPGAPVFDVSWWITRGALDIIGDAGFSYKFSSLKASIDPAAPPSEDEREGDVLGNAFNSLFKASMQITLARFLQLFISSYPGLGWLQRLPTKRQRTVTAAFKQLESVSMQIVEGKKREIREEMRTEVEMRGGNKGGKAGAGFTKADFDEKDTSGTLRKDGVGVAAAKDLLHLMMRANMADDVHPREKLDDSELIGQITTLLLAGHETTSNQTSWTLWTLASHPEVEKKLRAEIYEHFGTDMDREIGYDELMGMEYLDAVCKEMMRCLSAVPNTVRIAKEAAEIPLSKPYKTRDGRSTFTSLHVSKGQEVLVPIQAINSSTEIWGPDAEEFNPDRWFNLPDSAKQNGLPMHLMTFISGPRGCIGNRFALAEFKAMLCHLVGRFHFAAVDGWEVEAKQSVVIRPRIIGQEDLGPQMPLRVTRV